MKSGKALIAWYDKHKRTLPWRYENATPDPYKVWVSEIMLQQTTVAGVIPYYEKFLQSFPNVKALAAASQDEVLDAWAGLGYYARARNLHKTANIIVADYNGKFPQDEKALLSLAGIGDYTAAAIMAIAFNQPAVALDGNGKRVLARLFAETAPVKNIEKKLRQHYADIFYHKEPSAFAQAMMDLGAMICTPTLPQCTACPMKQNCKGKTQWQKIPHKVSKSALPIRYGAVSYLICGDEVILGRRDEKSMLGGCVEFIGTEWDKKSAESTNLWQKQWQAWCKRFGIKESAVEILPQSVEHSFTHYKLELFLHKITLTKPQFDKIKNIKGVFVVNKNELSDLAFPSLMKKVFRVYSS